MRRIPATDSQYSFHRIGGVNPESERTTEIKFPPWVWFEPGTSWSTAQRVNTELSPFSKQTDIQTERQTDIWLDRPADRQMDVLWGHTKVIRISTSWHALHTSASIKWQALYVQHQVALVNWPTSILHRDLHVWLSFAKQHFTQFLWFTVA